jgi:hypothetical protein
MVCSQTSNTKEITPKNVYQHSQQKKLQVKTALSTIFTYQSGRNLKIWQCGLAVRLWGSWHSHL